MTCTNAIARTVVSVLHRAPFRHLVQRSFPRSFFTLFHQLKASHLALDAPTYVLSFDLDHRVDIEAVPRVLATLRRYAIPASFACIGRWIEEYPDVHRAIVADGHEIVNHSYTHPDHPELSPKRSFRDCSPVERHEEIERCHAVCMRVLRDEPVGFRIPHFGRAFTGDTYEILQRLGYRYSSSTIDAYEPRYGVPSRRGGVVEIPLGCSSRYPFLLFDSYGARRSPRPLFSSDAAFLEVFDRTLAAFAEHRSFLSHYFDPADVVGATLEGFCVAIRRSGVVTTTYRAFLEQYRNRLWTKH